MGMLMLTYDLLRMLESVFEWVSYFRHTCLRCVLSARPLERLVIFAATAALFCIVRVVLYCAVLCYSVV